MLTLYSFFILLLSKIYTWCFRLTLYTKNGPTVLPHNQWNEQCVLIASSVLQSLPEQYRKWSALLNFRFINEESRTFCRRLLQRLRTVDTAIPCRGPLTTSQLLLIGVHLGHISIKFGVEFFFCWSFRWRFATTTRTPTTPSGRLATSAEHWTQKREKNHLIILLKNRSWIVTRTSDIVITYRLFPSVAEGLVAPRGFLPILPANTWPPPPPPSDGFSPTNSIFIGRPTNTNIIIINTIFNILWTHAIHITVYYTYHQGGYRCIVSSLSKHRCAVQRSHLLCQGFCLIGHSGPLLSLAVQTLWTIP